MTSERVQRLNQIKKQLSCATYLYENYQYPFYCVEANKTRQKILKEIKSNIGFTEKYEWKAVSASEEHHYWIRFHIGIMVHLVIVNKKYYYDIQEF